MWIFIGAGLAVLTALIDPDGSLTGFVTAIVFIASVYGLMAAPTLRSLLYAAGLAAIAALAFAAGGSTAMASSTIDGWASISLYSQRLAIPPHSIPLLL